MNAEVNSGEPPATAGNPPAVAKILLFLTPRAPSGHAMANALRAIAQSAAAQGIPAELWSALPPSILGDSPQGQAGPGAACRFVLELTDAAPVDTLLAEIATIAEPDTGLDIGRSALFAGHEYGIVAGRGNAALFCPLIRKPHLSAIEFQRYWLDVHAEFGRRDPRNGYRQLHPAPGRMADAAAIAGLPQAAMDGVAEAYFRDTAAMQTRLASPAIAGDAYADEQRFIDHARSSFLPFERVCP